jgi:alcohol dehydrogenase class IV
LPDRDGADCSERIAAFVGSLPLPRRLRDVGVEEAELAEIARLTMFDYMMANLPRPMTESEVLTLLRSVW